MAKRMTGKDAKNLKRRIVRKENSAQHPPHTRTTAERDASKQTKKRLTKRRATGHG